jgi:hypothetical protein
MILRETYTSIKAIFVTKPLSVRKKKNSTRAYLVFVAICWGVFTLCVFSNFWSITRDWLFRYEIKELIMWLGLSSYILALFSPAVQMFRKKKHAILRIILNMFIVCSFFALTSYFLLKILNVGDAIKPKGVQLLLLCYAVGISGSFLTAILLGIWGRFRFKKGGEVGSNLDGLLPK